VDRIPPEIIGRAIQDPEFRQALLDDPRAAAATAGVELDDEQVEALTSLDPGAIERAVEALLGDLDYAKYGRSTRLLGGWRVLRPLDKPVRSRVWTHPSGRHPPHRRPTSRGP